MFKCRDQTIKQGTVVTVKRQPFPLFQTAWHISFSDTIFTSICFLSITHSEQENITEKKQLPVAEEEEE